MRMFDLYNVDLTNNIKSEQGGIRPCIIIQNNLGNKYSPTLIVIPLTSEIKKSSMPTHCVIHKSEKNNLKYDSMVLGEQLRVVDKERLRSKIGEIDKENDQNNIIAAYIANITGSNKGFWRNIIYKIFSLIKESNHGSAA